MKRPQIGNFEGDVAHPAAVNRGGGEMNDNARSRAGAFPIHKANQIRIRGGRAHGFDRGPEQEPAGLDDDFISPAPDGLAGILGGIFGRFNQVFFSKVFQTLLLACFLLDRNAKNSASTAIATTIVTVLAKNNP
jgi:hypothetical protein